MALVLASKPIKHPNYSNEDYYAVLDTDDNIVDYITLNELKTINLNIIKSSDIRLNDSKKMLGFYFKNFGVELEQIYHKTVQGRARAITRIIGSNDIIVEFIQTGNFEVVKQSSFLNGTAKNPLAYAIDKHYGNRYIVAKNSSKKVIGYHERFDTLTGSIDYVKLDNHYSSFIYDNLSTPNSHSRKIGKCIEFNDIYGRPQGVGRIVGLYRTNSIYYIIEFVQTGNFITIQQSALDNACATNPLAEIKSFYLASEVAENLGYSISGLSRKLSSNSTFKELLLDDEDNKHYKHYNVELVDRLVNQYNSIKHKGIGNIDDVYKLNEIFDLDICFLEYLANLFKLNTKLVSYYGIDNTSYYDIVKLRSYIENTDLIKVMISCYNLNYKDYRYGAITRRSNIKDIKLSKNKKYIKVILSNCYFYIDYNDFDIVFKYRSSLSYHRNGYIQIVNLSLPKSNNRLMFHRLIVEKYTRLDKSIVIDHINGVGIDNRYSYNLRKVSVKENMKNKFSYMYSTSWFDKCHSFKFQNSYTGKTYNTELDCLYSLYDYLDNAIFKIELCRSFCLDILDDEIMNELSLDSTFKRICETYLNNAWYVARFNLYDFFNKHNIPIPEFKLNKYGFMVDETGLMLKPDKSDIIIKREVVKKSDRDYLLSQHNCCACCGSTNNLTIDHIIPVAKGGTSDLDNLQVLCYWCNLSKGANLAN